MSNLLLVLIVSAVISPSFAASQGRDTDWEFLGNSPEMQHHSDLAQINHATVARLGLAWAVDIPSVDGLVGNPLVKDGVVFQSGARGRIFANDLRTGVSRWIYEADYRFNGQLNVAFGGRYNRGLALAEGLAIVATGDCRLIAVDQKSGKKVWESQSCNSKEQYSITGAPRVGGGLVYIGNTCLDSGETRGYVDALDVKTGKHAWRFYTVPGDPSLPAENDVYRMAAKTWGTNWYSKTKGCGSAWDALTYDSKLSLLYIGVGGPAPFDPSERSPDAGDELFTNSVVAVNAKTGEYVWHFKEVPHDGWNFESSVGIMVADLQIGGHNKRVVISVPKSGFLYVLDAKTGQFISGKNYTPINWAKGLDRDGRPIIDTDARYWEKPGGSAIVLPSNMGAHGWEALAYSPAEHLVYIPVQVMPTRMIADKNSAVGSLSMDYYVAQGKWQPYGEVVALDPVTETIRWRHRDPTPVNGGLLHSGDLVFEGTADGHFNAYDDANGRKLWSVAIGGASRAAPSTVMLDGEQYILVASGNANSAATTSYVSRYAVVPTMRTQSRLLAFKLGGNATPPMSAPVSSVPKPAVARFDARLERKGENLFEQNMCVDCHGYKAESAGGAAPDLRYAPPANAMALQAIVMDGALSSGGMPPFPDLKTDDVKALYAFLINQAWDAYAGQKALRLDSH